MLEPGLDPGAYDKRASITKDARFGNFTPPFTPIDREVVVERVNRPEFVDSIRPDYGWSDRVKKFEAALLRDDPERRMIRLLYYLTMDMLPARESIFITLPGCAGRQSNILRHLFPTPASVLEFGYKLIADGVWVNRRNKLDPKNADKKQQYKAALERLISLCRDAGFFAASGGAQLSSATENRLFAEAGRLSMQAAVHTSSSSATAYEVLDMCRAAQSMYKERKAPRGLFEQIINAGDDMLANPNFHEGAIRTEFERDFTFAKEALLSHLRAHPN